MKKEDLRIRKTKHSIKEAFIDLVKKKGYKKVSVTDIVKDLLRKKEEKYPLPCTTK